MESMHVTNFKRNGDDLIPAQNSSPSEKTNINGSGSYVELLTCFEMERDVSTARETRTSK
jgi:hypothetical protein